MLKSEPVFKFVSPRFRSFPIYSYRFSCFTGFVHMSIRVKDNIRWK